MLSWLLDSRIGCFSVMTEMSVRDYLGLVSKAHADKGAISGQRDTLKTTSSRRIRDRLVSDLHRGAIVPPVVIGVVVDDASFDSFPTKATKIEDVVPPGTDVSIIDGMQRTSALIEAAGTDATILDRMLRVEFWLARSVRAMVYRMLVLNTGQVPWNLARQLTVVYAPLLGEIIAQVPEIERVLTPDKPGRRVAAGEFSSDALVELYIAFSLKKTNIDAKEALSDEFSRLDFVENLSEESFQYQFYDTLSVLCDLDKSFSLYVGQPDGRFSRGRHIFDSQPARIGFVTAVAQFVLGRPGLERVLADRVNRMERIVNGADALIARLDSMDQDQLGEFLKLDVLREILDKRVGQVGRHERNVFFEGFLVLIDVNFEVPSLEPCWRAA